jgi:nicotinamidase-related amidase
VGTSAPVRPRFSGAPSQSARVLLIDWINPLDHDGVESLRKPATVATRHTSRLKKRLSRAGVPSVYANDNYGVWRSDFRTLLRKCRESGGASADIAELLGPARGDIAVLKPRHSGFYETPLQVLLQQLKARELIVTGVATEWCVLFTAMDAYVRGYALKVPSDCTASGRQRSTRRPFHT